MAATVPVTAAWKSAGLTPVTASLNVTVKATVLALVLGPAGCCGQSTGRRAKGLEGGRWRCSSIRCASHGDSLRAVARGDQAHGKTEDMDALVGGNKGVRSWEHHRRSGRRDQTSVKVTVPV